MWLSVLLHVQWHTFDWFDWHTRQRAHWVGKSGKPTDLVWSRRRFCQRLWLSGSFRSCEILPAAVTSNNFHLCNTFDEPCRESWVEGSAFKKWPPLQRPVVGLVSNTEAAFHAFNQALELKWVDERAAEGRDRNGGECFGFVSVCQCRLKPFRQNKRTAAQVGGTKLVYSFCQQNKLNCMDYWRLRLIL